MESIFPRRYDLEEYEEQAARIASAGGAIPFYVDQAKRERALTNHERLVKLMADRLRGHGAVPKANPFIDLAANVAGQNYLFEMKSTTEDNPRSQVRRGLSQLYEYRYSQAAVDAKLVLVVENQLPGDLRWMEEYLIKDRNVVFVWDGDDKFKCPDAIRAQLPFLS